jgi:hypothetical protein
MGEAQAIPDHLYAYSQNATNVNDELRSWVRQVLTPAIERYQAGAIDYGNHIPGITINDPGPGGVSNTIDGEVSSSLSQIRDQDQLVYDIGQAFQRADPNPTPMPTHGAVPGAGDLPDENLVTTDDLTLDENLAEVEHDAQKLQQIQQSLDDGKWWADYANKHGIDDHVWQVLKAHLNDPYFLAAFFNGLDWERFVTLINEGFTAPPYEGAPDNSQTLLQALMTALDGGMLDPTVIDEIFKIIGPGPSDGWKIRFRQMLIKALQNDPDAARNFVENLSDSQLRFLLSGEYPLYPLGLTQSQVQAEFIKVLTAAMDGEGSPAGAWALYQRVADAIQNANPCPTGFPVVQGCDPQPSYRAIGDFLRSFEVKTLAPPPPNATPIQLAIWAHGMGNKLNSDLKPFLTWIKKSDNDFANAQQQTESMTVGLVTGLISTVSTAWLGPAESIGAGALETVLTSIATTYVEPWIHDQLHWPDHPDADADRENLTFALKSGTEMMALIQLIGSGQVTGPDGKVVDLTSSDNFTKVWEDYQSGHYSYYLTGTQPPEAVGSILDSIGARIDPLSV